MPHARNPHDRSLISVNRWEWSKRRLLVLRRDAWQCQYCGERLVIGVNDTVDHKLPRRDGGTDDYSNLVACCRPCQSPARRRERRPQTRAGGLGPLLQVGRATTAPQAAGRVPGALGPLLVRGNRS